MSCEPEVTTIGVRSESRAADVQQDGADRPARRHMPGVGGRIRRAVVVRHRAGHEVGSRWRRPAGRLVLALLVLASGCSAGTPPSPDPTSSVRPPTSSVPFFSVVLNTHDPVTDDLGFTAVDVTPSQVQQLPANRKGLVWLGGYDRKRCTLLTSDDALRQQFATYRLADDPRVLGYFVADEPNTDDNCPQSVEQIRARSALVHSLDPDPRRFTLVNVDDPAEFTAFKSTADVLATDPYPCRIGRPCNSHLIPDRIASLRRAGVTRYVAIVQAFAGAPGAGPPPASSSRCSTSGAGRTGAVPWSSHGPGTGRT